MRLHTDLLEQDDLAECLPHPLLECDAIEHRSTKRSHAFEFRLHYTGAKVRGDGRRWRNSGEYGTEPILAATWDEHGLWMARLFERDPEAIIGSYEGVDDFHRQTDGKYLAKAAA